MAPSLTELIRFPVALPAQLGRDVSSLTDAVTRLPSLVAGLDAHLRGLAADLATVAATANTLLVHVATMDSELHEVLGTVKRADAKVASLEQTVARLEQRVTRIDDGLEDRVPDLTPVPTDVDRLRRDIARLLELTPDPDAPGTLEKVRDALTPGA